MASSASSSANGSIEGRAQQSHPASQRTAQTGGTAEKRGGRFANLFPLGYKEGFSQWWSAVTPEAAEAAVLNFLPFKHPSPAVSPSDPHTTATTSPPTADPYGPRECTSTLVPLSGKNRVLNEFSITRTDEPPAKHHLVILHGYGAGLGFFYRNFDALSRIPGWKVWSLDLLGYGRSSRPPFTIHSKDQDAKITEAEDWFIDALEEWRKIRGIESFTLMGHSLGGYLSTRYCLKYGAGKVEKLILVSPVGVPEDPWAVQEKLPDSKDNLASNNEHLRNQEDLRMSSDANLPYSVDRNIPDERDSAAALKPRNSSNISLSASENGTIKPAIARRPLPWWFNYLWDANLSPFAFVRWSGPLGPRLVSGWTTRRFNHLSPAEAQALHNYSYSIFRQRGSGEYALAYILAPGAYARRPLIWKITDLVNKCGLAGIPSVWMYGSHDWMDCVAGMQAVEKIRSTSLPEGADESQSPYIGGEEWRGNYKDRGGEAKVLFVDNAGHHLYLDNADQFNSLISEEMKDVELRGLFRGSVAGERK